MPKEYLDVFIRVLTISGLVGLAIAAILLGHFPVVPDLGRDVPPNSQKAG